LIAEAVGVCCALEMAVIENYCRQAARCYERASKMTATKAASLIRLGDTYCSLALNPYSLSPDTFKPSEKFADPLCKKCGTKMQLTHALPRTHLLPAMQAFRCNYCGERQIWKDAPPSTAPPAPAFARAAGVWVMRYVAMSFRRTGIDFSPGPAIECPNAGLVIQRAELMMRENAIAGAVAFSRRSDPASGEVGAAVIQGSFGAVPEDFDIA